MLPPTAPSLPERSARRTPDEAGQRLLTDAKLRERIARMKSPRPSTPARFARTRAHSTGRLGPGGPPVGLSPSPRPSTASDYRRTMADAYSPSPTRWPVLMEFRPSRSRLVSAWPGASMTAAEFAARLEGRPTGGGKWEARCPPHDDRKASLCVGTGEHGRVLLYCQAGCETPAVVAAAGLRMSDLAPERLQRPGKLGGIVASYSYADEAGAELFQVVRFEPKGVPAAPSGRTRPEGRSRGLVLEAWIGARHRLQAAASASCRRARRNDLCSRGRERR